MFKKIAVFFAAVFVFMVSCAAPLIKSYAYGDITSVNNYLSYIGVSNPSEWLSGHKYIYFTFNTFDDWNNRNQVNGVYFSISDSSYNNGNYYINYASNNLVFRPTSLNSYVDCTCATDSNSNMFSRSFYAIQFDFTNNTFTAVKSDGSNAYLDSRNEVYTGTFDNFQTNFTEYAPQTLSLAVSFNPTLTGDVSMNETINGKDYSSKSLDLVVSNNGSDAQFLMCIVPTGGGLTFPTSTMENNKGFIGNPTFVYVTDEWSTFNVPTGQTSILAGCAWRAVPSGYQNQTYHILWSSMNLQANTSYDAIVYACLNPDSVSTNAGMGGFAMRGGYSVTSDLQDVQEVYRSTFTMSQPPTFNQNIVDEAGTGHAWNPNIDNSNLFTGAAAYKDDLGNITIRGQYGSNNGGANYTVWEDSNVGITNLFGNYFNFLNTVFGFFPSIWQAVITVGLITLVIVGILKAVS